MPIINGCKYSCEPCIRGHRATSCAHTDRILIEVRKPGRPLESCGHSFDSCQCGKIADLLAVGNDPPNDPFPEETQYIVASPSTPKPAKTKSRVRSSSRVNKRRSKPAGPMPTPTSVDRGLAEAPSSSHNQSHDPSCPNAQQPSYTMQQRTPPYSYQPVSYASPNISPYLNNQPMMSDGQHYGANQAAYIHAADCSSRIGNGAGMVAGGYRVQGQQITYSTNPKAGWSAGEGGGG